MKSMSFVFGKSLKKKVMVAIVGGVFLFFTLTGIVSTQSVKSLLLKEKYNTIKAVSEQVSTQLASGLNKTAELLATERASLEYIHRYPRSERRTIIIQNLKNLLENNPDLTSVWADWEPLAVDSLDAKLLNTPGATLSGKFCATVYRNDNAIELADYNSDDDEEGEYYTIPKSTRQLYITSPYVENYEASTDYLIITMGLPIILKDQVVGVVGADINISQLNQQIINGLKEEGGRFFIAGTGQRLLVYDKEEGVGKEASEVLSNEYSKNKELIGAIKSKASGFYDFVDSDGKEYLAYINGQSNILNKDDVSILLIPSNFLTSANLKVFFFAFFILFGLGLLIFYLLTAYIIKKIIDPINMVSAALKELAEGNYASVSKVDIKSGDELEAMALSFNNLHYSIEEVVAFAKAIGEGNLSVTMDSKGEGDILGNSLLSMRDNLVKADEEEYIRKITDEKQSWIERGVSLFGQELRQDFADIETLYKQVIKLIVSYIEANQGALYLIKEDEENNKCFEMVACMAWDRIKMQQKTFLLEEGLLGACYFEKAPIEITEIPQDYISISSGLGGSKPHMLMLIPLIHNEEIVGIVEVASFKLFDEHVKTYLAKISENFASSISSIRINARTNELLSISQIQAEEMQAQEEEMRQNIEELHATQEEMRRKATSAERLQDAIDQNFITILVNQELVVLDLNDKAKALLGHEANSIVGKPLTSWVHENDKQLLASNVSDAMLKGVVSGKLTIIGSDRQATDVQATLISDSDRGGNISFIAYAMN